MFLIFMISFYTTLGFLGLLMWIILSGNKENVEARVYTSVMRIGAWLERKFRGTDEENDE